MFLFKEQKYLIEQIKTSIIDKLYYESIVFESNIGLENASNTALSIGVINLICNILGDYFYTKNHDTVLFYNNVANFENTNISFNLQIQVYFTIFDLVFAIIMSFYKRGKYVKETKQK